MTNTQPTVRPLKSCGIADMRIIDKGNMLAALTVEIGALKIYKCKLLQSNDGSRFVVPPSEKFTGRDGQEKYTNVVSWPKEWNEVISHAGAEAYADESERNGGR